MRGLDLLKVLQKISNQREFCACSICIFPLILNSDAVTLFGQFFCNPALNEYFYFVFGDYHTNEKMLMNNILELKLAASAVTGREECCV